MFKFLQKNLISSNKGFTLIELLVVIAIIGILSTVVLSFLHEAKIKANDSRRKSDFRQMSIALELYYDTHGGYPATGTTSAISGTYANTNPAWDTGLNSWNNLFLPLVNSGSMSYVPRDPVNVASGMFPWSGNPPGQSVNRLYHYRSNGTLGSYNATHYLLCTWLENTSDKNNLGHIDVIDPFSPNNYLHADYNYSIYNYCVGK
ncbi:MAG: prepilin-type N-terminal cleavage/methylation domain-containing protein [Candidatus Paceibacterota bacterium]